MKSFWIVFGCGILVGWWSVAMLMWIGFMF
jgi:hypothetical protein